MTMNINTSFEGERETEQDMKEDMEIKIHVF